MIRFDAALAWIGLTGGGQQVLAVPLAVPRISAFYGIVIYMHWREHAPAHFHAIYGEFEAAVAIEDGSLLAGELPIRASALVRKWAVLRRRELRAAWGRSRALLPLESVEPLP
ncbi:MAG: DUF4160 domain-containing protein [Candidatus Limnocylindria bacterium]